MALFTSCMSFQLIRSWRRASKCKKLITHILYRLKLLQARKSVIVTQTREDISKLLQVGQFQLAVRLAGELHGDQNRIAAYEIITQICDCISKNLSYISKNIDLPNDLIVAMSSLIFAASRCGELPELNKLRNLFREWYGKQFDATNVNLQPSNLVKIELKRTLTFNSVSNDMKLELVNEIIRDAAVTKSPSHIGRKPFDVSGDKGVSVEDDEGLVNAEARRLSDRIVQDAQMLELVKERGISSTNQEVDDERVRRMFKRQQSLSKQDEDPSPRESTDSTYQIQEKEIIYLDDMSRNSMSHHQRESPSQNSTDDISRNSSCHSHNIHPKIPSQNSTSLRWQLPLCSNVSVQPLPQQTSNPRRTQPRQCKQSRLNGIESGHRARASRKLCQGSQGEIKNCVHHKQREVATSSCRGRGRSGNMSFGHVHPNLPRYEDVVAKLKDSRT